MRKTMRRMLLTASLLAVAAPTMMNAQQVPGPHPRYIHALNDLRAARHYLNDGWAWAPVKADDNAAIREIDAAISLLAAAHADLSQAEDVPASRGLRNRAIGHVDHAHQIVDAAWRTAHW